MPEASAEAFARAVADGVASSCIGVANDRMIGNVGYSGRSEYVRYAHVPTSRKVCGYCCMHASNGFAYERIFSKKLHERYRCIFVPGIEGKASVGGYDPMVYYKGYSLLAKRDARGFIIRNDDGFPLFKSGKTFDTVYMRVVDKPERFMSGKAIDARNNNYHEYLKWVDRVLSGPFTINGHQKKHDEKSKEHSNGRSVLNDEEHYAYQLVLRYAGFGYPVISKKTGKWIFKEKVIADENVGHVTSGENIFKTSSFIIHYSKKGCHVVPVSDVW